MNFDKESVKNFIKNDEVLNKLDESAIEDFISSMNNLSPEDIQNFLNYQKTLLSMGYPTCKIMMNLLLKKSKSTDLYVKNNFLTTIEKNTNVEKVAGMNIEYFDTELNKKTYCYIIMNKCDKNHNILPQLDKIQKFFNEEQWKEILKNISMMIYICRNVYKLTITGCNEQIFDLGYDINDVDSLKVDNVNMTLYLFEEWDERVGIYIMRESDLEDEANADNSEPNNIEPNNSEPNNSEDNNSEPNNSEDNKN